MGNTTGPTRVAGRGSPAYDDARPRAGAVDDARSPRGPPGRLPPSAADKNGHYSAVLMPVVFLALADALTSARRSPRAWLSSYAAQLPAAVAAAGLALTTSLPLAQLAEAGTYRKPAAVSGVERLLARIPDGATVEANIGPISRLTSRCRVFWLGSARGITPEYIALENIDGGYSDPVGYAGELHPGAAYAVAGKANGYVVLERRTAS
ncbi:hypothetical protein ACF1G5_26230 [Streptomyces coeruleorubidus]|uniref:hypothetical protein n=1 Tax=Streptomyces coeruleorubidus TaxID=116188 RepID=UPI0037026826